MLFAKLFYKTFARRRFRVVSRLGCKWLLNYSNYVDRKLLLRRPFERAQLAYLEQMAVSSGANLFVDVGANFGLYSVLLLSRNPSLARGIAVEPQPRNFQQLNANLLLNGLSDRATCLCVGASSSSREVSFLENTGNSTGTSRIVDTAPASTKEDRFVRKLIQVKPLDELIDPAEDDCCVMKIDVEGHELEVLRGATSLLQKIPCLIQMEILEEVEARRQSIEEQWGLTLMQVIEHDFYFVNALMHSKLGADPPDGPRPFGILRCL